MTVNSVLNTAYGNRNYASPRITARSLAQNYMAGLKKGDTSKAENDISQVLNGLNSLSAKNITSSVSTSKDMQKLYGQLYGNTSKPSSSSSSSSSGRTPATEALFKKLDSLVDSSVELGKADYSLPVLQEDGSNQAAIDQKKDALYNMVSDFSNDYNSALKTLKNGSGTIVRGVSTSFATVGKNNKNTLNQIGINVGYSGQLSVDREKFLSAVENDSEKVAAVLKGTGGIAEQTVAQSDKAVTVLDKLLPAVNAAYAGMSAQYTRTYNNAGTFNSLLNNSQTGLTGLLFRAKA